MISYNQYRIRAIEEGDLDFITALRTSDFVQSNVGSVLFPNKTSQLEWLKNVSRSQSELFLVFELEEHGSFERIGMVRCTSIDRTNQSMCVGGDIREDMAGKSHGQGMYHLIFKLGFLTWNMNRLWLLVLETNTRAKKLYTKMGFSEEGCQRNAIFKNGIYTNYTMMSILKDEYKNTAKN